jgi:thiol-disulfide isomerase/thioredoxin
MPRMRAAAVLAALLLGVGACSGQPTAEAPTPAPSVSTSTELSESAATATPAGSWTDLSAYEADRDAFHEAGDVVLFFNAAWCPTCQATVKSLDASGAPSGLSVVSVDFDDSAELRKKYGVTVQHTFVQVDAQGKALVKFTGATSGADIASRTV